MENTKINSKYDIITKKLEVIFMNKTKVIIFISILMMVIPAFAAKDHDMLTLKSKITSYIQAHSGKLVMKDIRTLKNLSILSNIVIENAKVKISPKKSDLLFISGKGYINKSFYDLKKKKSEMVVAISSNVTNYSSKDLKWSIGWFFKNWSFLDKKHIKFSRTTFFWSNSSNSYAKSDIPKDIRSKYEKLFKNTGNVIRLRKQGNLFGILNISDYTAFKIIKKLIPAFKTSYNMLLTGYLTWPLNELELRTSPLSEIEVKLPKGITAYPPTLFMTLPGKGKKLLMGIELKATAKLPPHHTPMDLTGKISFPFKPSVNKGIKFALMLGDKGESWKDACNIKGLDIEELVFEVEAFPEEVMFGFRGVVEIGSRKIDVAATIPAEIEDLSKMSFSGKINEINLNDLFFFMKKSHPDKRKSKITLALKKIKYKDAQMTFSSITDRELNLSEGIVVTGTLNIFGKDIEKDELRTWKVKGLQHYIIDGYTKKSWIHKLKLGAFELTGKGFDGKFNTHDDGPTYELKMTLFDQGFMISGLTKLFDSLIDIEISLDLTGGKARFEGKIQKILDAVLDFSYNINWKAPYVQLKGSFDADFSSYLSKKARKLLSTAKDAMDKDIKGAKHKLDKAQDKVNTLKGKIDKEKKAFNKTKNHVEKKLRDASRKVSSLKKKIRHAEHVYKHCHWYEKGYYWGKVKVLKAARATADEALKIAKKAVNIAPLESDPKYDALVASYKTATFALKTAKKVMDGVKTVADHSLDLGKELSKKTEDLLVVKNAHFKLNYTDRHYAQKTKMFLESNLGKGKQKIKNFVFDMTKFKKFSVKLVKEIFKKAGGCFEHALDYIKHITEI